MTKICTKCKIPKPLEEFGRRADRRGGAACVSRCKDCLSDAHKLWRQKPGVKQEILKRRHRWLIAKGPEQNDRRYRKTYGISLETYDRMFQAQGGVCAICHCPERFGRRLAVDHCHTTGKVRGLLCSAHNTGLGLFQDSLLTMENAVEYLKSHSG